MAVIIGHSQVKYLCQYITNDTIFSLCFPGYKVQDLLNESSVYDIVPSVSAVAVVIGANDIPEYDARTIVENIQELCGKIHSINERATVVVFGVLPRADNRFIGGLSDADFLENFNSTADAVNRMLRAVPSSVPWLRYVDPPGFLTDGGQIRRSMLSRDGLHLNLTGTKAVAEELQATLKPLVSTRYPSTGQLRSSTIIGPLTYSQAVQFCESDSVDKLASSTQVRTQPRLRPTSYVRNVRSPQHETVRKHTPLSKQKNHQPVSTTPVTRWSTVNRFNVLKIEKPRFTWVEESDNTERSTRRKQQHRSITHPHDDDLEELVNWINDPKQVPQRSPGSLSGGGKEAVVFQSRQIPLTIDEVINIMKECSDAEHEDLISTSTPLQAKGGDIYVIDTAMLPNKNDIKVDDYLWINDGKRQQPKKNPKLLKSFFKVKLPDKTHAKTFQKHIFESIENGRYVIIHYLGDETVFENVSHGNAKNPNSVFRRTCPSVIEEIKSRVHDVATSANLIEKESKNKAVSGSELGIKTARNLDQVKNHLYKSRRELRLSNDDIYNLCEISYELENFNKQIDVFPSFVCVSGMDEILQEFNDLLVFDSKYPIRMYYDTTYKLGDVFVSVLSYQHIIFEDSKVIPLAFMLHDRRDTKFHERFFDVLKCYVSNLSKVKQPIMCDREPGIKLAINNVLPNLSVVHCWNHIKKDVKTWLTKIKATKDDLSVYSNHVEMLLKCHSESECNSKIEELEQVWSQEFKKYFHKHLKSTILNHSGRWILEELKIYNPYSGITTNPAECINNVIKSLQKRKELPIDLIAITLFFMQKYFFTEIQCGRAGFGKYKLKEDFKFAKLDPSEIKVSQLKGNPDAILKQAREQIERFYTNEKNQNNCITTENENNSEEHENNTTTTTTRKNIKLTKTQPTESQTQEELNNLLVDKNATTVDDKDIDERKGNERNLTQTMLAQEIIENDKIRLVSSMNAFVVEGIKGSKRIVTLTPKEGCSCPSTGQCYHILAVKMAINVDPTVTSKTVKNLSLLRKNSKPRIAKKTGQKRPRKTDFEVKPAPDSAVKNPENNFSTPSSKQKHKSDIHLNSSTPLSGVHSPLMNASLLKSQRTPCKSNVSKRLKLDFGDNNGNLSCIAEDVMTEEIDLSLNKSEILNEKLADKLDNNLSHCDEILTENNANSHSPCDTVLTNKNDIEAVLTNKNDSNLIQPDEVIESTSINLSNSEIPYQSFPIWLGHLDLNENDKALIANESSWLNDKIINASQILLKRNFQNCGGLQSTLFIPNFVERSGFWSINKNIIRQDAPSAQIHHNGRNHWLLSYQTVKDGPIYIIDSLKNSKSINTSVSIQLAQMYHTNTDGMHAQILDVQRQTNGSDCGVFAIANLTELLHSNFKVNLEHTRYKVSEMRNHLIDCLTNGKLTPFPKIGKMPKMPCNQPKSHNIKVYCTCRLPCAVDDMVKCENYRCKIKWFH